MPTTSCPSALISRRPAFQVASPQETQSYLLTAKRPLVSRGQKRRRRRYRYCRVPIGDNIRLALSSVSGQFQLVLLLLASLPATSARRKRLHQKAHAAHDVTEPSPHRFSIYLRFLFLCFVVCLSRADRTNRSRRSARFDWRRDAPPFRLVCVGVGTPGRIVTILQHQ